MTDAATAVSSLDDLVAAARRARAAFDWERVVLHAGQALARQPYDVVFMDVQMPEMGGLEATREIVRCWGAGQRPRIVAMTANALAKHREVCLAAGMDDYLAKPIRVEELIATLGRSWPRPA